MNTIVAPRISVIMGVFNGGVRLRETIESIQNQTESNWECIVVDDASLDSSYDLLESFAGNDHRFRVFRNSKNQGLTYSLNEALSRSSAQYIARHDTDDISHYERFSKQAAYLDANQNVGLVGSNYEVMDVDGSILSISRPPGGFSQIRSRSLKRNVFAHGSLMMRRCALQSIQGYRQEFQMAQDYDLILRLMEKWDLASLPETLYRLRLTPAGGSLSRLEIQNFYAEMARSAFFLREKGLDDAPFLSSELKKKPSVAFSGDLGDQRYRFLRALHLVKVDRTSEARIDLKLCKHPSLRIKAMQLALFSRLPRKIRGFCLRNS